MKIKTVDANKVLRISLLAVLDVVIINLMAIAAIWISYEFNFANDAIRTCLVRIVKFAPIYTVLTIAAFSVFKLYSSLWAFAGAAEMWHIVFAASVSVAFEFIGHILIQKHQLVDTLVHFPMPKRFFVIHLFLLIGAQCVVRFAYRIARRVKYGAKTLIEHKVKKQKRTMVVGAGQAGAMTIRELNTSQNSENRVVCLIDDAADKRGGYLYGIRVVGNRNDIPQAVKDYDIEEIIIAMPTAHAKSRRDIVKICQETGCELRTVPGLYQLVNGEVTIQKLRRVQVEDLLGRDAVKVNMDEILDYVSGKTVLVTGGGGSIGSELCRQIAGHNPKCLIIFDIYENNAYAIQNEIIAQYPDLTLEVLIGSVRDEKRVDAVFEKYGVDIVYHAAAHKHVPLMEQSPNEAIKNNVFGTYNVARAADKYNAEKFVMISTDKAVNPTNIMGASKRICEMIVQMFNGKSKTEFVSVRFGNVLGSNGSVIPLFRKQIEKGGPVTVTHKDIIRYFMTIPEAVSLVLQAGAFAKGGEIFVLDMGEPVRIDDLARNMIRLSGYEPDVDIKIEYTGLRPGEKLFEELLMSEEGLGKTDNQLIYIGHQLDFDEAAFESQLEMLKNAAADNSRQIKELVESIVPTYHITDNKDKANGEENAVKAEKAKKEVFTVKTATVQSL
ncbi:MAG: polysaccharide biosynthesis protein [Clostridia bacterium]|nr:polysaccharide biosynthesis protein [Clostridia bacterium]